MNYREACINWLETLFAECVAVTVNLCSLLCLDCIVVIYARGTAISSSWIPQRSEAFVYSRKRMQQMLTTELVSVCWTKSLRVRSWKWKKESKENVRIATGGEQIFMLNLEAEIRDCWKYYYWFLLIVKVHVRIEGAEQQVCDLATY